MKILSKTFNVKRLFAVSACCVGTIVFSACTEQIIDRPVNNTGDNVLTGVIENGLTTYTSISGTTGDASRAIEWTAGDAVRFTGIIGSTVSDLGSVSAENINGTNADFVVMPPSGLTKYFALYPDVNCTYGSGANDGKVTLSIPTNQTYTADGIASNTYPMVSVGTGSPLKFKGVAGVIRIELTGEIGTTINKVIFKSNGGQKVSGTSDWVDPLSYVEGLSFSYGTTACDSVVLNCPSIALSSAATSFYLVVANTVYPAGTTEICIEGSAGRRSYVSSQAITITSQQIQARSLFYGVNDETREYDAHFIVGDTLGLSGVTFTNAVVTGGGNWLTLSTKATYKSTEQTQNYSGAAVPLFIHLDENLTGGERSGLITATRSNGTIYKVLVTQVSAVYVGPFGDYGGTSLSGSPSEGQLDDSGQATPFSTQLRSGGAGYTKKLYTELKSEPTYGDPSITMNFTTTSIGSFNNSSMYSGLTATQENFDKTKYSTYYTPGFKGAPFPAINYCASKNRDENGDGEISGDEIKWYLPAANQLFGMWITAKSYDAGDFTTGTLFSATKTSDNNIYSFGFDGSMAGSLSAASARCVREVGDVSFNPVTQSYLGIVTFDFSDLPANAISEVAKGTATSSVANETLYRAFNVASKDCVTPAVWSANACAQYYEHNISEQGSWRLPTQREMEAILMYKSDAEKEPDFTALNGVYWTATEASSSNAFSVSMDKSLCTSESKTMTHNIRCVTEITGFQPPILQLDPYFSIKLNVLDWHVVEQEHEASTYAGSSDMAASNQERIVHNVVIYVYKFDGYNTTPDCAVYCNTVPYDGIITLNAFTDGQKKIFVAANVLDQSNTPLVYTTGLGDVSSNLPGSLSFYNSLNKPMYSTITGWQSTESAAFDNADGLIKTLAKGDIYGTSAGTYTSFTGMLMTNWDGADDEDSNGSGSATTFKSTCLFSVKPDIDSVSSHTAAISGEDLFKNAFVMNLQRSFAKVTLDITAAAGTHTFSTAGGFSSLTFKAAEGEDIEGEFQPWGSGTDIYWSLGNIPKGTLPFQVTDENGHVRDLFRGCQTDSMDNYFNNWQKHYDNRRVFPNMYSINDYNNVDIVSIKSTMLSAGNYTKTGSYAYSPENAREYPQSDDFREYAIVGGRYNPKKVITSIVRSPVTTNPPTITYADNYTWTPAAGDTLYYVADDKVFISGFKNVLGYYAWQKQYEPNAPADFSYFHDAQVAVSDAEYYGNFFVYYEGQCLYKVFIGDGNAVFDNRYVVRRNHIYKSIISVIKAPGSPQAKRPPLMCCPPIPIP